jgi:hypothetical protein
MFPRVRKLPNQQGDSEFGKKFIISFECFNIFKVLLLPFPSVFEGRDGPSKNSWTKGQTREGQTGTGETKGKFKYL